MIGVIMRLQKFSPLVLAICVSWVGLLRVAGLAAQDVQRIGPGVTPPKVSYKFEPEYSEEARKARLEGDVLLGMVVGADGQPRDLHVLKPLGLGLEQNAMAAVSQWKFTPGEKDGNAVAIQTQVSVSFRLLLDERQWRPAGVSFTAPPGAMRPVLLSAPLPTASGVPEKATLRVSFDLTEKGVPTNVQVEFTSGHPSDEEVIALIREWRFQAAQLNGVAVASKGTVEFSRGDPLGIRPPGAPPSKKRQ
jgi:TonB family protein